MLTHFILIITAFNLAVPSDPNILAHRSYTTLAECQKMAARAKVDAPENYRIAAFCVSAKDLITDEA